MHYTQFTHILLEDNIEKDPNCLNVSIDNETANGEQ